MTLPRSGKGLWRSRGLEGLVKAHVIYDELRVRVLARQLTQEREFSPTQYVHREAVPCAGRQYPIQSRIVGRWVTHHHDTRPNHPRRCRPFGNLVVDGFYPGIERFDQTEPAGMLRIHFERVTRVEAVHGPWRDQQGSVNANGIHRRNHVITRDLGRTGDGAPSTAAPGGHVHRHGPASRSSGSGRWASVTRLRSGAARLQPTYAASSPRLRCFPTDRRSGASRQPKPPVCSYISPSFWVTVCGEANQPDVIGQVFQRHVGIRNLGDGA